MLRPLLMLTGCALDRNAAVEQAELVVVVGAGGAP
jgi:hypothetical protein